MTLTRAIHGAIGMETWPIRVNSRVSARRESVAVSEYRLLFGRLERKGNELQAGGGRGVNRVLFLVF